MLKSSGWKVLILLLVDSCVSKKANTNMPKVTINYNTIP